MLPVRIATQPSTRIESVVRHIQPTLQNTLRSLTLGIALAGCGTAELIAGPTETPNNEQQNSPVAQGEAPVVVAPEQVDTRPPPMHQPVPLYENGGTARPIDAATARGEGFMVLDLGEEWTPYLFSENDREDEPRVPNSYRETYLALARGEFPDNHHGARAEDDKYLELYGIMPTLGLLRSRFQHTRDLACIADLNLDPLRAFEGFVTYESREEGRNFARRFNNLETNVRAFAERQGVATPQEINAANLSTRDGRFLTEYLRLAPQAEAIRAAQARLECEGYFEGKGEYVRGGLDWPTHEALAEFERRHRIYGWGFPGRETLNMLRHSPIEGEQEAVIRVLTERALHAAGVLEDGSVTGTYRDAEGVEHDLPDLEAEVRSIVVESFGLTTPESTLAFLEGLGELPPNGPHLVAVRMPDLPDYYGPNMDISVEIDRGDVWYEFPYDELGHERAQPVERRPHTTILVTWNGQRIPLARYGTTIGGWRTEEIDHRLWWRYKNSPPGPVVWHQIVAAPVWLPPESTPARDLFRRTGQRGAAAFAPNYHETGPSYASAYGLVAAYHIRYQEREDGTLRLGGDEGIRSHGSVDYMSIMRRHSHGCHRLHNHMAVRLMSFALEHRTHTRVGQQAINFGRNANIDGHDYHMEITSGGYVYQLAQPIPVNVLEGRIRGVLNTPIETPLPRFDETAAAYVLPDGSHVSISRTGVMTPVAIVPNDAGVGVDAH